MNGVSYFFMLFFVFVKLGIQLSNLCKMMVYCINQNKTVLFFSHHLVIASLSIQDNTVMNGVPYFFMQFFVFVKLGIQLSNLCKMMLYCINQNKPVLFFSHHLVIASLSIQDNTVMNGVSYFFTPFFVFVKLGIQLSNLCKMMLYCTNQNNVLFFSHLLISSVSLIFSSVQFSFIDFKFLYIKIQKIN